MACVDIPPANADSEMEEGEIVDELDYLSDISSEEEFLLRQRLKVLENYNNALERKEAKKSTITPGKKNQKDSLYSDISGTDGEDNFLKKKFVITKEKKHARPHHKASKNKAKIKQIDKDGSRNKDYRKKKYQNKNKINTTIESEDSDVSDDEMKIKRRKLADAVALNIVKHDTTSTLKERLTKMLGVANTSNNDKQAQTAQISKCINAEGKILDKELENLTYDDISQTSTDFVDTSSIEVKKPTDLVKLSTDAIDSPVTNKEENNNSQENSDEDLEILRQYVLKTKSAKPKKEQQNIIVIKNKTEPQSEDEDSDTAELRMICLKSTLLKKAIEMKQKQKLRKRLSNSSNMHDFDICGNDINLDNNTDIESVDMEIGSDADDKDKDLIKDFKSCSKIVNGVISYTNKRKDDELEEDEDLLRAKLLTSLSKNLPNLIDVNVFDSAIKKDETKNANKKVTSTILPPPPTKSNNNIEEKKFIIQLGDSDSEAEHEATKNLTKMHQKLSEQAEFQMKLDQFLKSTRMEVEKTKLPDVVQEPVARPPEKFVAKTMHHLPKSEQIEYKNLVKRMAELEKMKQARQQAINISAKKTIKDTLKPRNFALDTYKVAFAKKLEEKIALSRKNIAEESAKMLKLKEEATKLSQRYKIVATELKNIATAITLNKKQQKTVQNGLCKIRHQHQMLLKSAPSKHSNQHLIITRSLDVMIPTARLQKENEPLRDPNPAKPDKLNSTRDHTKDCAVVNPTLTIQVDISSNKKVVKLPKSPTKDKAVSLKHSPKIGCVNEGNDTSVTSRHQDSKNNTNAEKIIDRSPEVVNDYKSPLDVLRCKNWEEDPNAVLCPFEFGGSCRDPDCKYLHPKILKQE